MDTEVVKKTTILHRFDNLYSLISPKIDRFLYWFGATVACYLYISLYCNKNNNIYLHANWSCSLDLNVILVFRSHKFDCETMSVGLQCLREMRDRFYERKKFLLIVGMTHNTNRRIFFLTFRYNHLPNDFYFNFCTTFSWFERRMYRCTYFLPQSPSR